MALPETATIAIDSNGPRSIEAGEASASTLVSHTAHWEHLLMCQLELLRPAGWREERPPLTEENRAHADLHGVDQGDRANAAFIEQRY